MKPSRKLPPGQVMWFDPNVLANFDPALLGADRTVATLGTNKGKGAFVAWAERALAESSRRTVEKLTSIYADAGVIPMADDDYVYLANEAPRTPERQAEIASEWSNDPQASRLRLREIAERDLLVNGDWPLPEAPPVTTRPIDDPESEEYRQAAFKREWAEMIGLFNIVTSGSAMANEARTRLNIRLAAHGIDVTVKQLQAMDSTGVLDTLAPIRLLAPPADPRFGPMVAAENERMARAQYAAMRHRGLQDMAGVLR